MIRMHHYLLVFMLVLFSIVIYALVSFGKVDTAVDLNVSYKENLESALESAMASADLSKENVFSTEEDRKIALKTFYDAYERTIEENRSKVEDKMPVVILLDNNGYYVCYDKEGSYFTSTISPINKWANTIGSYTVSYSLNGDIEVFKNYSNGVERLSFSGSLSDVVENMKEELGENEASVIENALEGEDNRFSGKKSSYIEETDFSKLSVVRSDLINKSIEDTVNYYVNNFNTRYNDQELKYKVNILGASSDSQRKIVSPTIMAFVQGPQKDEINIYAFVGTKKAIKRMYSVKKDGENMLYHELSCIDAKNIYTMEECASMGAYPHSCVR